jgi:hypothetical protein
MTMKVSIPMFWTLKSSGMCPYEALNITTIVLKIGGGDTPTSRPSCIIGRKF